MKSITQKNDEVTQEVYQKINNFIKEKLKEQNINLLPLFNGDLEKIQIKKTSVLKTDGDLVISEHYVITYHFHLLLKDMLPEEEIICTYTSFYMNGNESIRQLSFDGSFLRKDNEELCIELDFDEINPEEFLLIKFFQDIDFIDFMRREDLDKKLCGIY